MLNAVLIKTSASLFFFVDIGKITLKFIKKSKRTIIKVLKKKNRVGEITIQFQNLLHS